LQVSKRISACRRSGTKIYPAPPIIDGHGVNGEFSTTLMPFTGCIAPDPQNGKKKQMKTKLIQTVLAASAIGLLNFSMTSDAATAVVLVGSGGDNFVPAVTNINAGDRVIWSWVGNNHNTTSTGGLWASATMNIGTSFTNTFNSAGTFNYTCTIHAAFGMTGSIVVSSAANTPPTVSITNLSAGAVFAAPATITIRATASDSDGSVTNVQFRVGSVLLGNATTAPYSATTNNLAAGNYTLSAIASDNKGSMATNSVSISVVAPVDIVLSSIQRLAPSTVRFSYTANAGLRYVVQQSTDLSSGIWNSLSTNTATSGLVNFTNLNTTPGAAYYRVGRLPNP
jgi:plastocyanin